MMDEALALALARCGSDWLGGAGEAPCAHLLLTGGSHHRGAGPVCLTLGSHFVLVAFDADAAVPKRLIQRLTCTNLSCESEVAGDLVWRASSPSVRPTSKSATDSSTDKPTDSPAPAPCSFVSEVAGDLVWCAFSPSVRGRAFISNAVERPEKCGDLAARFKPRQPVKVSLGGGVVEIY